MQNEETYENLISPCQNHENHEVLKIQCQTLENNKKINNSNVEL